MSRGGRRKGRRRRIGNGFRSIALEEERKLEGRVICQPDIGLEETSEEDLDEEGRREGI